MKQPDLVVKHHAKFKIEPIGGKNAQLTQSIGCDQLKGYKFWITSGNLLGIYRDNKLIDHDTDIDVCMLFSDQEQDLNDKIADIVSKLSRIGFALIRTVVWEDKPMQIAFIDMVNDVIFDIYFFYEKGDTAYNYNTEGYIHKPMKFLMELGCINFEGELFPCPNHLEDYLVWRFGENWKTPTGKKVPWQQEATHLKKWE